MLQHCDRDASLLQATSFVQTMGRYNNNICSYFHWLLPPCLLQHYFIYCLPRCRTFPKPSTRRQYANVPDICIINIFIFSSSFMFYTLFILMGTFLFLRMPQEKYLQLIATPQKKRNLLFATIYQQTKLHSTPHRFLIYLLRNNVTNLYKVAKIQSERCKLPTYTSMAADYQATYLLLAQLKRHLCN